MVLRIVLNRTRKALPPVRGGEQGPHCRGRRRRSSCRWRCWLRPRRPTLGAALRGVGGRRRLRVRMG
eukprot:15477739-Alexandrium_andersonii.AAC.1